MIVDQRADVVVADRPLVNARRMLCGGSASGEQRAAANRVDTHVDRAEPLRGQRVEPRLVVLCAQAVVGTQTNFLDWTLIAA